MLMPVDKFFRWPEKLKYSALNDKSSFMVTNDSNKSGFIIAKKNTSSVKTSAIGKSSDNTATSRWFPFTYEVIILQWAAILIEQLKTTQMQVLTIKTFNVM